MSVPENASFLPVLKVVPVESVRFMIFSRGLSPNVHNDYEWSLPDFFEKRSTRISLIGCFNFDPQMMPARRKVCRAKMEFASYIR